MSREKKPLEFLGDALASLRDFPGEARREAGYQLDRTQTGEDPTHYRPMPSVGRGVVEIKIREDDGAFRVFYVANRGNAIYVLHCFQKKSQKTDKQDIEIGKKRYSEIQD
jgi:phage-related protein